MANPADWLLDLISVHNREEHEDPSRARVQAIVESWATYERKLKDGPSFIANNQVEAQDVLESDEPASMPVALPVIMERMMKNMWRQKPGEH